MNEGSIHLPSQAGLCFHHSSPPFHPRLNEASSPACSGHRIPTFSAPSTVVLSWLSPGVSLLLYVVYPLAAEILMHLRGQWSPMTMMLIGQSNFNFMPTWASLY